MNPADELSAFVPLAAGDGLAGDTVPAAPDAANDPPPAVGRGEERTPDAPMPTPGSEAQQTAEFEAAAGLSDAAPLSQYSEAIQQALVALSEQYEFESDAVRRHHVRRFREAEEFWRGNQILFWAERDCRWHTPFEQALDRGSVGDLPRYDYVTNIYQAFGLSVIAAISQQLPRVRFEPVSTLREEDIATARAASLIADLIERNNRLDVLAIREAYLLWTQGMFGAYVRYVVDEEFGTHPEPVYETVQTKLQDAGWTCVECGGFSPSAGITGSEADGTGFAPEDIAALCPSCGAELTVDQYQPEEHLDVPVISRIMAVPNGQEKISLYGGLNLKVMPYANELRESAYLILVEEQHVAALRATYPAKADQIGGGSGQDGYERQARMALVDAPGLGGMMPGATLVTYKRCWLRPWAFWAHEDSDVRAELLRLFPDGCMVATAGDVFLEARPERMDDHWRICRAMPGVGMYTEPVGGSLISIQKRINDLANIQAEHVEYGAAPPILYDARYINGQALANKRMEPASYTPVVIDTAPGGKPLSEMIWQPRIGLDPGIYAQGNSLMELAQFLTGALPAVFGGSLQDVTTATGYGMARDQALGRLGLFWRQIKQFHADLMLAAVEIFRRNRTQDVEQVVMQRSGDYASRFVRLNDLKGNVTAHPEADDAFPATWSEIRANIIRLMQTRDPYLLKVLSHPVNAELVKNYIGTPGIVLPDEDNRSKQFREIDELLRGEPVKGKDGVWIPSVIPDPLVDDAQVHIETIQEWAVSDDGIEAKRSNPAGYANVMAHLVEHQEKGTAAPR